MALRTIELVDLNTAKDLVEQACGGKSFAHLGLRDLVHLAGMPTTPWWLRSNLRAAIIDREKWRLYVPGGPDSVRYFHGAIVDPSREVVISHTSSGYFEKMREEVREVLRESAEWREEVQLVRDEPEALLLHFLRVPEGGAPPR